MKGVCEIRRKCGSALVKHSNQIYEKEEIIAFKYEGSNVVQNYIHIIYISRLITASVRNIPGYVVTQ